MRVSVGPGWWTGLTKETYARSMKQVSRSRPLSGTEKDKEGTPIPDSFLLLSVRTLRELEHWLKRWHGAVLTGVNFKKDDDGWLVVVKVDYKGRPLVAFARGPTFAEALVLLALQLATEGFRWRDDKYPTK